MKMVLWRLALMGEGLLRAAPVLADDIYDRGRMKMNRKMPLLLLCLGILALLVILPGEASAYQIAIQNASFENPSIQTGTWTQNGTLPDWTLTGAGGVICPIIVIPPDVEYVSTYANTPDGNQYAWVEGATISQVLGEQIKPDHTYTIRVYVGNRLDTRHIGDYSIQMWAGSQQLISYTDDPNPPAYGSNKLVTVSYQSPHNLGTLSGQYLEIRLADPSGQTWFDMVRLEAIPNFQPAITSLLLED